jgi:drug/metabolite transporter (DMT)-like permease
VRAGLSRPSSSTLATLGLLLVTVVWGSTFFLIKDVVERMPVPDFLAVRFAIATVVLAALQPGAVRQLSRTGRRRGVVLGATYGIAQIFQTVGLDRTHASVSGFITSMYVVFTPLLAGVFLRHRIGRVAWAAVALSTFGLGVLSLKGFHVGSGEVLTLICAALYAAHIVGLGAWSTPRNAYALSIVQMAAITVVCAVAAAPDGLTLPPDAAAWAGVVYTAVCAGALALVIQTWAQAHLAPTRAAIIMTMEPVFAGAFAVALGGESLTPRLVLGGGLVLAAMYLAEVGARRGVDADVPHVSAP